MPLEKKDSEKNDNLTGLVSGRLKDIEGRLHSKELVELYGKGPLGFALSEILLIKDWSKVSGIRHESYTYMGNFVSEVRRNLVILAVSSANIVGKIEPDPPYILLTGPGLYQIEFSVQKGMYINDSREITGLLLSATDWERIRSAKKAYDGTSALVLNEIIAEIPLSIVDRPASLQTYERGLIANTVLTPFKDAFTSLRSTCSRNSSYPEEHGPKLLSTHKLFHNLILVGEEIYKWASTRLSQPWTQLTIKDAKEYLREIPGVSVSKPSELDRLLQSEVIEGMSKGYLKDAKKGISLTSVPSIKEFMMRTEIRFARDQYLKAFTGLLEKRS